MANRTSRETMNSASTHYQTHKATEGIDRILLALGGGYGFAVLGLAMPDALPLMSEQPLSLFTLCLVLLPLLVCSAILFSFVDLRLGKALALSASILFPFTLVAWNMGWLGIENLGEPPTWAWGFSGSGIGVAAASLRGRWTYVHGAITALLLLLVPLMPAGHLRPWSQSVQDSLLALTLAFVVCEPFLALRRSAARTDDAHDQLMIQYRSAAVQRAADEERNKVDRLIHDQVLSALRLASVEFNGLNADQLRQRVHLSLAELNATFDRNLQNYWFTPADLFAELTAKAGAYQVVPTALGVKGSTLKLPQASYEALAGAALEAVRNSTSHAPRATRSLELKVQSDGVQITVTDDGPGFDFAKVNADRLGIRDSILARCRDAGCTAAFRSAPNRGVSVILRYEDQRQ
ncbi:sensor histidine kinase [Glutamicibacter arilaitensis]|uniref:sensor histidine kinase n=1 Tax=Glutamicibacter arilaitensis TaxID=256701 RepID=UPI00384C746C